MELRLAVFRGNTRNAFAACVDGSAMLVWAVISASLTGGETGTRCEDILPNAAAAFATVSGYPRPFSIEHAMHGREGESDDGREPGDWPMMHSRA